MGAQGHTQPWVHTDTCRHVCTWTCTAAARYGQGAHGHRHTGTGSTGTRGHGDMAAHGCGHLRTQTRMDTEPRGHGRTQTWAHGCWNTRMGEHTDVEHTDGGEHGRTWTRQPCTRAPRQSRMCVDTHGHACTWTRDHTNSGVHAAMDAHAHGHGHGCTRMDTDTGTHSHEHPWMQTPSQTPPPQPTQDPPLPTQSPQHPPWRVPWGRRPPP